MEFLTVGIVLLSAVLMGAYGSFSREGKDELALLFMILGWCSIVCCAVSFSYTLEQKQQKHDATEIREQFTELELSDIEPGQISYRIPNTTKFCTADVFKSKELERWDTDNEKCVRR